jgi:hypothetical protein
MICKYSRVAVCLTAPVISLPMLVAPTAHTVPGARVCSVSRLAGAAHMVSSSRLVTHTAARAAGTPQGRRDRTAGRREGAAPQQGGGQP